MAYYLRFFVELEVYDGDSAASVDRSFVSFGSDAVARPGQSFVLALAAACVGDEVRVEAELNGGIDAAGRLTVKAKMHLFEGTTCETLDRDGSSTTVTTTDLSRATAPVEVYNVHDGDLYVRPSDRPAGQQHSHGRGGRPASPDDRATLTTHMRLLPYDRFGVAGGLTDVRGLMRQIGVVL
jgi:hypothetical protein